MSPISLVLYPIIYSGHPQDDVERVVQMLRARFVAPKEDRDIMEDESEEEHRAKVACIIADIRAELSRPTQRVRDILNLQSAEQVVIEADVREFLRRVADGLENPPLGNG